MALTNGIVWRAYKVNFTKPIEQELVVEINLCELSPSKDDDLALVWLFCKEGWPKAHLDEYFEQHQALNRFTLGALIMSEPVVDVIRRELRRISPQTRIDEARVRAVLVTDVLRREVLEGAKADSAKKRVAKAAHRVLRKVEKQSEPDASSESISEV